MSVFKSLAEMSVERKENLLLSLQRADDALTQFSKTFVVLNAGGILAVLGLLQALAGKDDASYAFAFAPLAVTSVGLFITGLVAAGGTYVMRFAHIVARPQRPTDVFHSMRVRSAILVAIAAFWAGSIAALVGVCRSFL